MKAIQIKYMPESSRFKAWAIDNKAKYYPRDFALGHDDQAEKCALEYAAGMKWSQSRVMGTLPNGDWVSVARSAY